MKRVILVAMVAALGMASTAEAALILRVENLTTGQGIVVQDGGVGDSNGMAGVVTFSGGLGGFIVNVTTGLSKPVFPGGGAAGLDLNSVNVLSGGAGTLQITLIDTDYTTPATLLKLGVGGTMSAPAGSSVTFQGWGNAANLTPALGAPTGVIGALPALGAIPAGSVPACSPALVFNASPYSGSCLTGFIAGPANYSLFTQAVLSFTGAGSASFDMDVQATVPEPGSMILLGTGLLGLAAIARRRLRKN